MENKKIIASFELTIMIVSLFAFAHGIQLTEETFEDLNEKYPEAKLQSIEDTSSKLSIGNIINAIFNKIKEPMIPLASAQETGCCSVVNTGEKCATTTQDICSGQYAEGALCEDTSFCRRGCCSDVSTGVYDQNVLSSDCSATWTADPNCNIPEARNGCCVLSSIGYFETQKQCEIRTTAFAQAQTINWSSSMTEAQCAFVSMAQNLGACVLTGGSCKFISAAECNGYDGQFNNDYLCTASSLGTSCTMTDQTTCVVGKDGVYFKDSCGNTANIYDSSRATDQTYWETVIPLDETCGDKDIEDASANSPSCGNCNRFVGSICGSALEDSFKVDMGSAYCKDTSCMVEGKKYENGESWCVYDGAIGEGNDVVGSRHWKYVCSQGEVNIEPCADYRNQICVQSNTEEVDGVSIEFKSASCIGNNWRECISLNNQQDGAGQCADSLNCMVKSVKIADNFKFDVCTPKYPAGFDLGDERYQGTAANVCGMASQKCKVIWVENMWGDCKVASNAGCLTEGFAREMNEFCRSLGDCGGEANIIGEYSDSYHVSGAAPLVKSQIAKLKELAKPVPGQYAEVEDYSKYLGAAGIWAVPGGSVNPVEEQASGAGIALTLQGVSGVMTAVKIGTIMTAQKVGIFEAVKTAFGPAMKVGTDNVILGQISAYAGVAVAASAGFMAGQILGSLLGLSSGGSMLMGVAGALAAVAVAAKLNFMGTGSIMTTAFATYLLVAAIVLVVFSLLFGSGECHSQTVSFECKPWRPPAGGEDCSKCNGDPLKPCSEYRCESLGAACAIRNKGTSQEMCESSRDNGVPPTLTPQLDVISQDQTYSGVSDKGFTVSSTSGGCIDAYSPFTFGITTDELSHCKYDMEQKEFENMRFDLGGNVFIHDHATTFKLPDPSHGQSQGSDWTGDLTLYIKCMDAHGQKSPNFYTIDMCVNQGPDTTAPVIVATEPANDALIKFDTTHKNISITTNELATCKWDSIDQDYSLMANSMTCEDTLVSPSTSVGYVCTSTVPTSTSDNIYYIKCMDQPWLSDDSQKNVNTQSTAFKLRKPAGKIVIDWIEPSRNITSPTDMTTIDLQVKTSLGGDRHHCSYSFSGYDKMIEMFETGSDRTHGQVLNRPVGTHQIFVECRDETGDFTQSSTQFGITRTTIEMSLDSISDFQIGEDEATVKLIARTLGGGRVHTCAYAFDETGTYTNFDRSSGAGIHRQSVKLGVGRYDIYVRCQDEAGNTAEDDTSFKIALDTSSPQVARIWQTGNKLHFITTAVAECKYSNINCNFKWDDGTPAGSSENHVINIIHGKTYHIRCMDQFGNAPSGCTIDARAL